MGAARERTARPNREPAMNTLATPATLPRRDTSEDAATYTAEQVAARLAQCGHITESDFNSPSCYDSAVMARAAELLKQGQGSDLFAFHEGTRRRTLRLVPKVGMGVTYLGYTDRHPYEVTKVVSKQCLEVRAMKATGGMKKDAVFIPGGFVGHVVDQHSAQEWKLESDTTAEVKRIRLGKNGWKDAHGSFYEVGYAHRFHDFNF